MNVAVLVACFNRADTTIAGLKALFAAAARATDSRFTVFLVDDASPDGTGREVAAHFPQVHVIAGSGHLFWNRGMCLAYTRAMQSGSFDAYLLFNDDVEFFSSGLEQMTAAFAGQNRQACAAIVGPVICPSTRKVTYSGYKLGARFRPLDFIAVLPDGTLQECDTFNGNCVLIPAAAMHDVGGLDPAYHHAFGDLDLGLALRKRGCKTFVLQAPIGYCEENPPRATPSLARRIAAMFSPPSPLSDRIHFTFKRYAWPVAAVLAAAQVIRRCVRVLHPGPNISER